jgi:hypothetical protein
MATEPALQAAVERLQRSRGQLALALRPPARRAGLQHWMDDLIAQGRRGAQALRQGVEAGLQPLAPWVREHPAAAMAAATAVGALLYTLRVPLVGLGLMQLRRWWRMGQGLLVQQALDPKLIGLLLRQLRAARPPGSAHPQRPPQH